MNRSYNRQHFEVFFFFFFFFFLFFQRKGMISDNSHEMKSLIFSEKINSVLEICYQFASIVLYG